MSVEVIGPGELGHAAEPSTRMAWAISTDSMSILHIGMLTKEKNGLKCGCICPSCKASLQAVNLDKEANHFLKKNTRGKFFRHAVGQQTNGCAIIAARLAALQLLFQHGEILLPAPRVRTEIRGASGTVYAGTAFGEHLRAKVRHRVWVDPQTARLTLDAVLRFRRIKYIHCVSIDYPN